MREVRFDAGETIFAEGDPSEHCYRIRSGRVEIRLRVPGVMKRGRSETIATCGPGELIGEMSVIDAAPRSATAVAVAPTVCETFTADEILNLLEPAARLDLDDGLAELERIAQTLLDVDTEPVVDAAIDELDREDVHADERRDGHHDEQRDHARAQP